MNRSEINRKIHDVTVISAMPVALWRRSLEILDIPDDEIAVAVRRRRMSSVRQYLLRQAPGYQAPAPRRRAPAPSVAAQGPAPRVAPSDTVQTPAPRLFGVEIECCGAARADITRHCGLAGITCLSEGYNHVDRGYVKIVSDSSIRGRTPNEVVMPPARDFEALKAVLAAVRTAGGRVNKSTGLHVHIDASGLSVHEGLRISRNYYHLRALVNRVLSDSRLANGYCLNALVRPEPDGTTWSSLNFSRYRAVNLMAYQRHGTIEFRQHQGSLNFAKIERWVRFLRSLVDWSITHELTAAVTDYDDPRIEGLDIDQIRV